MSNSNAIRKLEIVEGFDIIKETENIINENAEFIKDLLINQLAQGKDSKNENVTLFGKDSYSRRTIQNKLATGIGLGKVTEYITNYMSGAFYSSIRVVGQGDSFVFESDIEYFGEIIKRSGTVIMALNQQNVRLFLDEILKPQLEEKLLSLIGGL